MYTKVPTNNVLLFHDKYTISCVLFKIGDWYFKSPFSRYYNLLFPCLKVGALKAYVDSTIPEVGRYIPRQADIK